MHRLEYEIVEDQKKEKEKTITRLQAQITCQYRWHSHHGWSREQTRRGWWLQ